MAWLTATLLYIYLLRTSESWNTIKTNYTAKHLFLLKLNPLFPLLAPICCVSDGMEYKLAHEQFWLCTNGFIWELITAVLLATCSSLAQRCVSGVSKILAEHMMALYEVEARKRGSADTAKETIMTAIHRNPIMQKGV